MLVWHILLFLMTAICAFPAWGEDLKRPQNSDPRLLSSIDLPTSASWYTFDVSDDGKILYIAHKGSNSGAGPDGFYEPTVLHVYDVSDPRSPRELSTTNLSDAGVSILVVKGPRAFLFEQRMAVDVTKDRSHFVVVDVGDPNHPRRGGSYVLPFTSFQILKDGQVVALAPRADLHRQPPVFVDVTDIMHLHEIDDPSSDLSAIIPPGHGWVLPNDQPDNIPSIEGEVIDARGGWALISTGQAVPLSLYDISSPGVPRLISTATNISGFLGRPKILSSAHALAVFDANDRSRIDILSLNSRPFSAVALLQAYRQVSSDYRDCLQRNPGDRRFLCRVEADNLHEAGIEVLLDEQPAGITAMERVLMLNDYGFWLTGEGRVKDRPADAVKVLQKVVSLSPARTVAWLNLGDAARRALEQSDSYEKKQHLAELAVSAYDTYRSLAGKDAPGAGEFREFNVASVSEPDVCRYVADFYMHGQQAQIGATLDRPIDIYNDGHPIPIALTSSGSLGVASIKAIGNDGDDESNKDIYPIDRLEELTNGINVIPFKGRNYIIETDRHGGGPVSLADLSPQASPCYNFIWNWSPVIEVNRDAEICSSAATKRDFAEVPVDVYDPKLADGEATSRAQAAGEADIEFGSAIDVPEFGAMDFHGDQELDVTNADRLMAIGYFYEQRPGACDPNAIVSLLDHGRISTTKLNRELLHAEATFIKEVGWECGASISPIIFKGRVYIQADHASLRNQSVPSRSIFQLSGDHVELLCKIRQKVSYTPA